MSFRAVRGATAMDEVFKVLFSKSIEGVLVVDTKYRICFWNPRAISLTGYKPNELQGVSMDSVVAIDQWSDFQKLIAQVFNGDLADAAEKFESTFRRSDGEFIPVEVSIYDHIHSNGEALALVSFIDISRRKAAQLQAFARQELLEKTFMHTPAAIAVFDTQMRYITVSEQFMKDYGLDPNRNIIGLSHYEVFPEIPSRWKKIHKRCLAGETLGSDEDTFTRSDGSIDWVRWKICPWYKAENVIGGIILISEVITDKKNTELELIKLNAELEDRVKSRTREVVEALEREKTVNELKSRFVSMASHEFRTPLSALLSSANLLEKYVKPQPGSKEIKHFSRIKSSVSHLTEILNDFLSLDKLESGKYHSHPKLINLREIAISVIDEMNPMLKKGQQIWFTCTGADEVVQDEKVMRNILYNLLSNAVKYSGEGKKIDLITDNSDHELIITVKDEGIGIPLNEQQHMFTRLFRAKNAVNISGTGLGLNIVKRYVDLMGGAISFESETEKGTNFLVKIPMIKSPV